jgi:hypothetical protein
MVALLAMMVVEGKNLLKHVTRFLLKPIIRFFIKYKISYWIFIIETCYQILLTKIPYQIS